MYIRPVLTYTNIHCCSLQSPTHSHTCIPTVLQMPHSNVTIPSFEVIDFKSLPEHRSVRSFVSLGLILTNNRKVTYRKEVSVKGRLTLSPCTSPSLCVLLIFIGVSRFRYSVRPEATSTIIWHGLITKVFITIDNSSLMLQTVGLPCPFRRGIGPIATGHFVPS